MQSWYGLWMEHQSKHQELLREAERERLVNRLRTVLQANAGRRSGQAPGTRDLGKLVPDRLRPAER